VASGVPIHSAASRPRLSGPEHLLGHLRAQALAEEEDPWPLGLGHGEKPLDNAAHDHLGLSGSSRHPVQ